MVRVVCLSMYLEVLLRTYAQNQKLHQTLAHKTLVIFSFGRAAVSFLCHSPVSSVPPHVLYQQSAN